jgi:hypothetical protein
MLTESPCKHLAMHLKILSAEPAQNRLQVFRRDLCNSNLSVCARRKPQLKSKHVQKRGKPTGRNPTETPVVEPAFTHNQM